MARTKHGKYTREHRRTFQVTIKKTSAANTARVLWETEKDAQGVVTIKIRARSPSDVYRRLGDMFGWEVINLEQVIS